MYGLLHSSPGGRGNLKFCTLPVGGSILFNELRANAHAVHFLVTVFTVDVALGK